MNNEKEMYRLVELSAYIDNLNREELILFVLEALSVYIGNSFNGFTDAELFTIHKIISNLNGKNFVPVKDLDSVKDELYDSLPNEMQEIFNKDLIYGYYKLWQQTRSEEFSVIIDMLVELSSGSSDEAYTQIMFVNLFDYFLLFYNNKKGYDIEVVPPDTFIQNGGGIPLSFIAVLGIFLISFLHFSTSFSLSPRITIKRRKVEGSKIRKAVESVEALEPDSLETDSLEPDSLETDADSPEVIKPKSSKTSQFLRTATKWFKHKSFYDENELVHVMSQALPVISKSLDVENCNYVLYCIENALGCCHNLITNGSQILGIHERFRNTVETIDDWRNKVKFVKDLLNKTEEKIGFKLLTFVGNIYAQGVSIPKLKLINLKKNIIDNVKPKRSTFTKVLTALIKISDNPRTRKYINDFVKNHRGTKKSKK